MPEGTENKTEEEPTMKNNTYFEELNQIACTFFVKTQIREYTKLGKGAVFQTIPEFPEFCWTELIVNAAAHRDYSIGGTDIQIKMFDDHFTVESP